MPTPLVPVAQYLRKSTEHQQYSLTFQSSTLKSYAEKNNFAIVQTYSDSKSGLVLKRRKGLVNLLRDVVAGGQPYKAILVYDVSRWGRFLDADESAHYEFLCTRAGIPVHYCAETFPNDGSMPSAIMKSVKRVMAAEFSRELSAKVTLAMTRMVQEGLWPGSMPGYGLRRLLVSNDRTPKCPMRFGQRKNLRFDRTLIVPGPPEEIAIVKEIFRLYAGEKKSFLHIAGRLNALPSRDTLVHTIIRVYTSERTVRETPLAGIEAVALVNKGCGVSLPSRRFPEDCLPSIAVARPLIQDKDPSEVAKIANTLQQLTGQVVECHCRALAAHVQRSQLLAASARNLGATETDSEIFGLLDQPVRDVNRFNSWHRQPQGQTQVGG